MLQWLSDWFPWIVGGGAIAGVVGAAMGLSSVMKILATIIDVVSPVAKWVLECLVALLGWFWRTVIWPANPERPSFRRGIRDICDDWVTICTVAVLFWGLWAVMDARHDMTVEQLGTCQTDVAKLKKAKKNTATQPDRPFWLPW